MTVKIIQEHLNTYACANVQEEEQALREVTQEVILAGLARTDFFKRAQFHGGTCLRIFHSVGRFSEDLDFVLKARDKEFVLESFLSAAIRELTAYGFQFEVLDRSKTDCAVKKAFLKDDSIGKLLEFDYIQVNRAMKKVRIKVEVDTNPPLGAGSETKYLTFPFPASVTVHDAPSLFAGKLHALLCREYIKGRDWYDLIWYITRKVKPNYGLLGSQIGQTGPWAGQGVDVTKEWCFKQLMIKVNAMDWDSAKREVMPFIRSHERPSLEIWGADFFTSVIEQYLGKR